MSATKFPVLIAVDGSRHSDYAVNWYAEQLHQPGNEVLLLHVSEPDLTPLQSSFVGMAIPHEEWQMIFDKYRERVEQLRTKYEAQLKAKGITSVRFACRDGKPGERIVQEVSDENCRMVVLGTRGLGTVRRTIMGSVSNYVVHHSHVPVAVCRQE